MPITLEIEGAQALTELMRICEELGTQLRGVHLNNVDREGEDTTNAEIAEYLRRQGRDFKGAGDEETDRIAKAAAEIYEQELGKIARVLFLAEQREAKGKSATKRQVAARAFVSGAGNEDAQRYADQIATKALKGAMHEYMRIVSEHIENQTGPDGDGLRNPRLNEDYAAAKQKDVGFDYPIGKRTGQLLSNLNPDAAGSGKVRVTRK